MDIENIILAVVLVLGIYYLLKFLPRLIVIVFSGIVLSFVLVFVVRDMWNLPVHEYVDVSKMDEFRWSGQNYVGEVIEGKEESPEDSVLESPEDLNSGDNLEGNLDSSLSENPLDEDLKIYSYSYSEMTKEDRILAANSLESLIDDKRFKEKFLGMNEFVDIRYDLGNADMFNEKGNLIVEIK